MADRYASSTLALAACGTALATLVPITLYQTGVIPSLPDPAGSVFASETITSSKDAHPLGIPDGVLGLASYGVTLSLLLLSRRNMLARRALGAKLVLDGSMAGFNVVRQVVSFGKLCSWCTGTALATFAMVWAARETIGQTFASGEALSDAAQDGHLLDAIKHTAKDSK